jgi:MFS family permease
MLGMPAQTALIAESLPKGGRSSGFAVFRTITSIPMIITSLMGGVLMDYYGVLRGCRLILMASIVMTVLSLVLRWKYITETLEKNQDSSFQGPSITEQVKGLGNLSKDIWVIIVVAAVSSFAARGVMSFMVIYGVEVVGLTKTQWGIIGTIVSIITTLLTTPSGILADRIGRKPLIIASRTLASVSTLGYTFSENFTHMCVTRGLGGIGSGLGGAMWGPMGGPVWQALVADLTPPSERAKIMGFIGTIGSIVSTPASWVGGYMYENLSPALPFRASFILDTIGTVIFIFFLREPKEESVVLEGPDSAQREL